MALAGEGLHVNVMNNIVTGAGPTTVIAQNGIQVGYGATGIIRGNEISGNYYISVDVPGKGKAIGQQSWVSCGILIYASKPGNDGVFRSKNKIQDNQIPVYVYWPK